MQKCPTCGTLIPQGVTVGTGQNGTTAADAQIIATFLRTEGEEYGIHGSHPSSLYLVTDTRSDPLLYSALPERRRYGLSATRDAKRPTRVIRSQFLATTTVDGPAPQSRGRCVLSASPAPVLTRDELLDLLQRGRAAQNVSDHPVVALANLCGTQASQIQAYLQRCKELSIEHAVLILDCETPTDLAGSTRVATIAPPDDTGRRIELWHIPKPVMKITLQKSALDYEKGDVKHIYPEPPKRRRRRRSPIIEKLDETASTNNDDSDSYIRACRRDRKK